MSTLSSSTEVGYTSHFIQKMHLGHSLLKQHIGLVKRRNVDDLNASLPIGKVVGELAPL